MIIIEVYIGENANEVWKNAVLKLKNTNTYKKKSRCGDSNELLHCVFSISNPRERWVIDRVPTISIAFALAEVVWIFNGSSDAKIINYWNSALSKYAGDNKDYHGAYGARIRKKYNLDQMIRAYEVLKNNPNSRQVVISIWNPNYDMPDQNGKPINADIPCNICSMVKVDNDRLEWTQIIRSNDIFRGVPYNFVQFTTLQEILAGWLEIEVGTYTQFSDSLHLYSSDKDIIEINNKEYIDNSDKLSLNKEESEKVFGEIFRRMKYMADDNFSQIELRQLGCLKSKYESYNNIMYILALYVAYKKGYTELEAFFLNKCSNKLYCYLWNEWKKDRQKSNKR